MPSYTKVPDSVKRKINIEERFFSKIEKTNSCWNWIGGLNTTGYGVFFNGKKIVKAHRFMYELVKGDIQKGLQLDHLCRNTKCVNPQHLEAVTPQINVLRGIGIAAKEAQQTHCKHGHKFDESTIDKWHLSIGKRMCKECQKKYYRDWKSRHPDYDTRIARNAREARQRGLQK